jgi:hypothetical protein
MPIAYRVANVGTAAGVTAVEAADGSAVVREDVRPLVPAAKVGQLTTRTDADTGILTMTSGHGITTGAKLDVFWATGSRRNLTVGTVATNSVPIDGGSGDDLPENLTAVTAMVPVEKPFTVNGDDAEFLAVKSEAEGYAVFADTFGSDIPDATFRVTPASGKVWGAATGGDSPIAGVSTSLVKFSHGSTVAREMIAVAMGPGTAPLPPDPAIATLTAKLLHYWKCDTLSTTTPDAIGSAPLTKTNDVTAVAGQVGNCLQKGSSGGDGYLSVAGGLLDWTVAESSWSVALWFYVSTTLDGSADYGIFAKPAFGFALADQMGLTLAGSILGLQFGVGSGSSFAADQITRPFSQLPIGWHLIYCYQDVTAGEIGLRVDDNAAVTTPKTQTQTETGQTLAIFQRLLSGSPFNDPAPDGTRVDEIGIYNAPLTDSEWNVLWNGGGGNTYPFL